MEYRRLGNILKKLSWDRTSYVVSSKVFFGCGPKGPNQVGLSRKHIFEACHAALKRLQLDYLDLYFCHRPDKNTPMEEIVWSMNQLIQQGKILYWGTSQWSAQELMAAHMVAKEYRLIGPTMEQPHYNMFHRDRVEEEYKLIYKTVGLGTTIWSPLASGTLTDKYLKEMPAGTRMDLPGEEWLKNRSLTQEKLNIIRKLNTVALNLNTSLAKLAVAWCIQNKNVSTAILGASKVSQLKETLSSIELLPKMTDEVNRSLEEILQNKPKETKY